MAKRYARVNFQNRPSVATPLNDVNLNKLDKGIDDCDNAIEEIYNTSLPLKIDKTSISTTDTENSTTKVAAAAVTYQHGNDINDLKTEEDITLTLVSGVTGKCYKNHGTGLIKFTITISTALANPTLIATLPTSVRPSSTQVIKGVAKQTSGFGRCNLSVDTDGYVQLAAIDLNEPMNDLTFTSFWK